VVAFIVHYDEGLYPRRDRVQWISDIDLEGSYRRVITGEAAVVVVAVFPNTPGEPTKARRALERAGGDVHNDEPPATFYEGFDRSLSDIIRRVVAVQHQSLEIGQPSLGPNPIEVKVDDQLGFRFEHFPQ
jgi:hypothetical protein